MIRLYSINTNKYEIIESKHQLTNNIDYSYLTDSSRLDRFSKLLPHKIFNDAITVYCDANMTLLQPKRLVQLCNTLEESDASAIFFKHPQRTTSRQEIVECISRRLLNSTAFEQYNRWRRDGFPDNIQLMENNVLIRKTNDQELINCETIWYDEYIKGMKRDQPSLPYAIWKSQYQKFIILEQKIKEEIFKWRPHGT